MMNPNRSPLPRSGPSAGLSIRAVADWPGVGTSTQEFLPTPTRRALLLLTGAAWSGSAPLLLAGSYDVDVEAAIRAA